MFKQAGSAGEPGRIEKDGKTAGFIFSCVSITCIKLQGFTLSYLFFSLSGWKKIKHPQDENLRAQYLNSPYFTNQRGQGQSC